MKTLRLPLVIGVMFVSVVFSNSPAFASCIVNTDWPDAPCMDLIVGGRYPQDQVDKWAQYYDYKGAQFMESKKIQMDKVISEDRLMEWVNESIQNSNVWQYYYFSGQAPSPYPQNFRFDPIHRNTTVNYYDFRNAPSQNIPCGIGAGLSIKEGCEFENFVKMSIVGISIVAIIGITILLFKRK
jgi:hypothetical protein